jgi:plastocyanin
VEVRGVSQRRRQRAEQQQRRRRAQVAVAGSVVGLLALGGLLLLPISSDADSSGAVEISMTEYAFDPVDATAAPGDELKISNDGAIAHNYAIPALGKGIEVQPGEEGTLHLPDDAAPGSYPVVCDLTGHTEAGMVGTLEIG